MLAQAAVRTTGINWESIAAIAAIMAVVQAMLFAMLARRDRRREVDQERREKARQAEADAVRQEVADSVNHLSEVLLAKLETKETVARISERLARVEGKYGVPNSHLSPIRGRQPGYGQRMG